MLSTIFNYPMTAGTVVLSKELSSQSLDRLIFKVGVSTAAVDLNDTVLDKLKLNVFLSNGVSDGQDDVLIKNVQLSKFFVLSDYIKGTGGLDSLLSKTMYFDVLLSNIVLTGDDRLTISLTSSESVDCSIKMYAEDVTKGHEKLIRYEQISSISGQTHNLNDVAEIYSFGNSQEQITISDFFGDKVIDIESGQCLARIDGAVETDKVYPFGILYKDFTQVGIDLSLSGVDNMTYLIISHATHSERLNKLDKDTRNLKAFFEDLKIRKPKRFSVIQATT